MASRDLIISKYVEHKWVIHPLEGKLPIHKNISGLNDLGKKFSELVLEDVASLTFPDGCNIGLVCGEASGVVVLDIDIFKSIDFWKNTLGISSGRIKKSVDCRGRPLYKIDDSEKLVDGMVLYEKYKKRFAKLDTTCVRTGSGGLHFYFEYNDDVKHLTSSSDVVATKDGRKYKWDIKTTGGYVVLPPSVHPDTGVKYQFVNKSDAKPMPKWLLKLLPAKPQKKEAIPKSVQAPAQVVKEKHMTPAQILDLLSEDRVDVYSDWIKIGQALKNCDDDEEYLFGLWDEWSQKSSKYEDYTTSKGSTLMRDKWNSFRAKWNYGTLWNLAKEDNPTLLTENYCKITQTIIDNIDEGELGHSKIVAEVQRDNWTCIDKKKGTGYMWNENSKLWKCYDELDLLIPTSETLVQVFVSRRFSLTTTDEPTSASAKIIKDVEVKKLSAFIVSYKKVRDPERLLKPLRNQLYDSTFLERLDTIPHLLPIRGGKIVNLKSGEVRDRIQSDMFSFECNVSLGDEHEEEVEEFMKDLMWNKDVGAAKDKLKYLQTMSGLFLTGEVPERALFVSWGTGANAKTVYLQIMEKILGDYYTVVDKAVFIKSRNQNRHPGAATPHLIPIVGSRLGTFSESEIKEHLNEGELKTLTGGDTVTARPMYGMQFTFKPVCKLMMVTNFKPEFNIHDQAMTDRLKYLPFEARFVENPKAPNEKPRDKNKVAKMMGECLDSVFAWMVKGAVRYYAEGLDVPPCLKDELKKYITELDVVQQFIDECLESSETFDKLTMKMTAVYQAFIDWCSLNNETPISNKAFVATIGNKGYNTRKLAGSVYFSDYKLIEDVA